MLCSWCISGVCPLQDSLSRESTNRVVYSGGCCWIGIAFFFEFYRFYTWFYMAITAWVIRDKQIFAWFSISSYARGLGPGSIFQPAPERSQISVSEPCFCTPNNQKIPGISCLCVLCRGHITLLVLRCAWQGMDGLLGVAGMIINDYYKVVPHS